MTLKKWLALSSMVAVAACSSVADLTDSNCAGKCDGLGTSVPVLSAILGPQLVTCNLDNAGQLQCIYTPPGDDYPIRLKSVTVAAQHINGTELLTPMTLAANEMTKVLSAGDGKVNAMLMLDLSNPLPGATQPDTKNELVHLLSTPFQPLLVGANTYSIPFSLWPIRIVPKVSFTANLTSQLDIAPYQTFFDDTMPNLNMTVTGTAGQTLSTYLMVQNGQTALTGSIGTASITIGGPGYYVVDAKGLRLATAADLPALADIPSVDMATQTTPDLAPSVDLAPTCGTDNQPSCDFSANNGCDAGFVYSSADSRCHML